MKNLDRSKFEFLETEESKGGPVWEERPAAPKNIGKSKNRGVARRKEIMRKKRKTQKAIQIFGGSQQAQKLNSQKVRDQVNAQRKKANKRLRQLPFEKDAPEYSTFKKAASHTSKEEIRRKIRRAA